MQLFAEMLQNDFMVRALLAGLLVGFLCPAIGTFLVVRRLSLMADTLSHVALAGVAAGAVAGLYPGITATAAAVLGAVGIEELRQRGRLYGDTALAMFLSGGLALAVVLMSITQGPAPNLMAYLFGSIVTVGPGDLVLVAVLGAAVAAGIYLLYKELFYISFDEEAAAVSGIPVRLTRLAFSVLTALTIVVAMRIVGVLLVSALMVIPAVTSMRWSGSFRSTLLWAVATGELAVLLGLTAAYRFNWPAGASIVLAALALFSIVLTATRRAANR